MTDLFLEWMKRKENISVFKIEYDYRVMQAFKITDPNDNITEFDGTDYVEHIAYNAKGQRLLIAFGNDVMTRYVYSSTTFRLQRQRSEKYIKSKSGSTITYSPQAGTNKQDDKYIYDLIGNIFGINIRTTACGIGGTDNLNRIFDYDPLNRVTSGTGRENVQGGNYPFPGWNDVVRSSDPNSTQAYTRKYAYDKVGNVQQIKQLGTSGFTRDFNYIPNKNKLNDVEIGTNHYAYSYDNCGNQLTENTTRQFEWDSANRLILFKNQVGSSEPSVIAQYLYDSSGNRVKKIVRKQGGNYEIRTYIDGIFEYYTDETDEQNTVHIMDDQSRVAILRVGGSMGDATPGIKYELENNIYSSTVVLDDLGAIVNTQEYYPFGETSFGSYGKKRYQYVGKERDEESGLYYYGARYYSAWIARFISCDPLSAKYAHLSPYNYSDNNPINDFDIDGMQNNNSQGSEQGKSENSNSTESNSDTKITGVNNENSVGIPTTFYDETGAQTAEIPEVVQKMFQEEYGITLGYKNGKLFKAGDYDTNLTVSTDAKAEWEKALASENVEQSIIFGYELALEIKPTKNGGELDRPVIKGDYRPRNKTAYIDLADFTSQGVFIGAYAYGGGENVFSMRSDNLARVIEHEFIGHGLKELTDDGYNGLGEVENLLNSYREQMNLMLRDSYGYSSENFYPNVLNPGLSKHIIGLSFGNGSITSFFDRIPMRKMSKYVQ